MRSNYPEFKGTSFLSVVGKYLRELDSKGLWRWCILFWIAGLWTLTIVRYSKNWIFFHRQAQTLDNSCQSQGQSYITTDRLSASPSWYQRPTWEPRPIFLILSLIFFYNFEFVDGGSPLWREVRSVLFSFCRASLAQPFSDLSPTGLMSIVYCLYFLGFLARRARFLYLFPPGTG
jgi:hypothetical protein